MINKSYFVRFFKESSIMLIVSSLVFALINLIIILNINLDGTTTYEYFTGMIYPLFIFLFLGPLYVLSYKDSKRKADVFYSLPISRTSFLLTRILVVLLDVFIIYFVSYSTAILFSTFNEIDRGLFNYGYVILFFFVTFLVFVPLFMFTTYFANKGNSILDKLIFMLFYSFAFIAFFFVINKGINNILGKNHYLSYEYGVNFFYIVSPLIYLIKIFNFKINKNLNVDPDRFLELNKIFLASTIVLILISIGLLFLLLREEKHDKIERIGQPSTSIFGYKIILPFIPFIVFGTISPTIGDPFYYLVLIVSFSLFISFYFIYKRKFIIQKDAIYLSAFFVLSIIIVSLCSF